MAILKLDLTSRQSVIEAIKDNVTIITAIADATGATLLKSKQALDAAVLPILEYLQSIIECDKPVTQLVRDDEGVVIDTLYFHLVRKPWIEITRTQVTDVELLRQKVVAEGEKTRSIVTSNAIIATIQSVIDALATSEEEDGLL